MIDCYENCKDIRNGVCPPMKMFCPKKLAEHNRQIRAEAIDEFLDKVKELYPNDSNALYKLMCIAEQLKEQK